MRSLDFINSPQLFNSNIAFVVHLFGINSKDELFKQLSDKLEMPDYFGQNWDALSDCFRDFHWIGQQKIIIVHDDCPRLNEQEFSTYLQILFEAIQDWKEGEEHSLAAVFPENVRDLVERYSF